MTFPTGGDFGNQILALSALAGATEAWGQWGVGFALTGDITGTGPMIPVPAGHLRLGRANRVQFGFGAFDDMPLWKAGGMLHWEAILSAPFDKTWAPLVTVGARLDVYGILDGRQPLSVWGGIEPKLGRHLRIGVFGSIGPGTVQVPSWQVSARVTTAFGPGTTSGKAPIRR
jgi:hypothetical protein